MSEQAKKYKFNIGQINVRLREKMTTLTIS